MRIALGVEYDGTHYHGWQRQAEVNSVQQEVESALSAVADEPITVSCSGRTDTGVHGLNQVIHFDTIATREERAWVMGTNCNLPQDIRVRWAKPVAEDFHARFSAKSRRYQYVIYNNPVKSSILRSLATWHCIPLDAKKMHEGAQYLLGEHDFDAYRAVGCQAKHPVRTISAISVRRHNDLVILDVTANGFLHHMVRNIIGVLLKIGQGERLPQWAKEVLHSKDRRLAGITAEPQGLYLSDIEYDIELPTSTTSFWGSIGGNSGK